MRIQVLIGATVTAVLVVLAVGIHYEMLSLISNGVRRLRPNHRFRVSIAVLGALGAHFIEVILFAIGWQLLLSAGVAHLSVKEPSFVEVLYFSASTYTSLGYGDIVPLGDSGLLAGSEALTGLVLIAWTASCTYFVIRAVWGIRAER
jgi:hypothetical protein